MDYSPKGHKEWDVTERLTLFTLAPYLVFYAFFCIKKGWELASCIFLNFLARWIPSESAHAQSWQEMGTSSSILAWKTPWTEEPGGL